MRITRRPLYFSSVPMRFAPRRRWRLVLLALLGGLLAAGGASIGSGLSRGAPVDVAAVEQPLAISARNGLPIAAWEEEFAKTPARLAPAPTPAPGRFRVAGTGIGLVLRAAPSSAAARIGLLVDGALLTALGEPVDGEGRRWRQVRTGDGDAGWVADAYLKPEGR